MDESLIIERWVLGVDATRTITARGPLSLVAALSGAFDIASFPEARCAAGGAFLLREAVPVLLRAGEEGAEVAVIHAPEWAFRGILPGPPVPIRSIDLGVPVIARIDRLRARLPASEGMRRLSLELEAAAIVADAAARLLEGTEPQGGTERGYVERAIGELRARMGERVKLSDIAASLRISEEYLVKLFREAVGTTPMRYLRELRIEAAEAMLSAGGISVKETSWRLGFASQYHFSKAFKALRGFSPKECKPALRFEGLPDGESVDDLGQDEDPPPDGRAARFDVVE